MWGVERGSSSTLERVSIFFYLIVGSKVFVGQLYKSNLVMNVKCSFERCNSRLKMSMDDFLRGSLGHFVIENLWDQCCIGK